MQARPSLLQWLARCISFLDLVAVAEEEETAAVLRKLGVLGVLVAAVSS
jgi:hypothetical protein